MESSNQSQSITQRLTGNRPVHGGVKPAELRDLGLRPEEVLDFSASVSPLGPPAGLWDALRGVDLAAYPDPQCLVFREALSRNLSAQLPDRDLIAPERILVGNGSTEIIHLLARAFLPQARSGIANSALLLTPTYGEYSGACRLAGATVSCLDGSAAGGFRWDLREADRRITLERPSLVFLCNPNNPTGVFLSSSEVELLASATSHTGGLLVVDEAYLSFADDPLGSLPLLDRYGIVMLRSMTKDYALTGLRLGYSLASEEVTERLASFQPDWSVNSLAQAAGLAALADTGYLPRARQAVAQAKEHLRAGLASLGFPVPPSSANFLLVQVGDGARWREMLRRRGFFVRDCASFGLADYIRVGIRSVPDCQRLVEAMAELA
jgi:histidinol-phosphate aminotransferase